MTEQKGTGIARREIENIPVVFNLPPAERVKQKIAEIDAFQELVRRYLKPGLDYGVIPGTGKKPTLLKPGAEKVDKLLDLSDNYEIIEKTEDWNKPFFNYLIRCELRLIGSNVLVSSGMGSCNSMESKYRYRWQWPSDVPEDKRPGMVTRTINVKGRRQTQYRTDNDDICSQVNTILKMAKKRAHIDATLSAARLSELFTQDIEDLVPEETLNTDDENDRIAEEAALATKTISQPTPEQAGQEADKIPANATPAARAAKDRGMTENEYLALADREEKEKKESAGGKTTESKIFIDMDWLTESLHRMKYADFGSYIRNILKFNVVTKGKTIPEIIEQLTREEQEKLVANLRERAAENRPPVILD